MKKLNKKEIKSYSNQILKTCKLWGYDPSQDNFEIFFDDYEAFNFIPCYKEGIDRCIDDDELEKFMEKFGEIVDEIIDNNTEVEITLEDAEKFAENFAKEYHDSLGDYIVYKMDPDPEEIINWILDNCDKQTKEKFLKWVIE